LERTSTYIQEPPFFEKFGMEPGHIHDFVSLRPLGIFGDSVTTDHISPAGAIKKVSPAGQYLTGTVWRSLTSTATARAAGTIAS
jgi:aconitate hydratase